MSMSVHSTVAAFPTKVEQLPGRPDRRRCKSAQISLLRMQVRPNIATKVPSERQGNDQSQALEDRVEVAEEDEARSGRRGSQRPSPEIVMMDKVKALCFGIRGPPSNCRARTAARITSVVTHLLFTNYTSMFKVQGHRSEQHSSAATLYHAPVCRVESCVDFVSIDISCRNLLLRPQQLVDKCLTRPTPAHHNIRKAALASMLNSMAYDLSVRNERQVRTNIESRKAEVAAWISASPLESAIALLQAW